MEKLYAIQYDDGTLLRLVFNTKLQAQRYVDYLRLSTTCEVIEVMLAPADASNVELCHGHREWAGYGRKES